MIYYDYDIFLYTNLLVDPQDKFDPRREIKYKCIKDNRRTLLYVISIVGYKVCI